MNLDDAHVQWVLGVFPFDTLPELGASMMEQGFEGPSILELASFHKPGRHDVPRDLVDGAFAESSRPPISRLEAVYRLIEPIARKVVDGLLKPEIGGRDIYKIHDEFIPGEYPDPLMPLIGAVVQWQDDDSKSRRKKIYEPEIVAGANAFLMYRKG